MSPVTGMARLAANVGIIFSPLDQRLAWARLTDREGRSFHHFEKGSNLAENQAICWGGKHFTFLNNFQNPLPGEKNGVSESERLRTV